MSEIDVGYLRECLRYDAESGALTWKVRPLWHFATERAGKTWNTRNGGRPAMENIVNGYKAGFLNGKSVYAHRIIWMIFYGVKPIEIDHINRIRTDNRILNLRSVSRIENCQNLSLRKNNTTGVAGIRKRPHKNRWEAYINADKKRIWLGTFGSFEDAVRARREAEEQYCWIKSDVAQ